ncbi:bifunctional diguanylate cyclase/phosphodiesterase [Shewanella sp. C32]|uniref:Bifunctional diguanylate cyclase/phosphodiesterase n=1 Tax=Shewanella electrica TaxID=515560 RepID=A0ABT2FN23_9GAMM|nr:bifunctional diguanylate cyclase/phosphodiesterase [Shewanella electrica]MCH1926296.1 bifunctional diguanylate cyclase/phosphodiesterase [Shewanella electrica]MCS4557737.1 bifunctional diguanylate cyclase/phosphodiesterase [Shewanella electrica]
MESPQQRSLYQRDATAILYSNTYSGLSMNLIAGACLVFGFGTPADFTHKVWWFALLVTVILLRAADIVRWRRNHGDLVKQSPQPSNVFCCGLLLTALLWCAYTLLFFDSAGHYEANCIMVIVFIMAAGAANALAADKVALFLYPMLLILPLSSKLIFNDNPSLSVTGWVSLAFCCAIIYGSYRAHQFTMEAIKLKNQNRRLVLDMEQKIQQRTQRIYELSNIDPLTGLLNRTAFLAQFNAAVSEFAQPQQYHIALFFIDLDRFKDINDNIGHRTGDDILSQVAERLKSECSDAISLCRWGGDEFLIALPYHQLAHLEQRAELLPRLIARSYHVADGGELNISASVGVALYPQHGNSAEELIQHADIAMYARKRSEPGGCAFYNNALAAQRSRELYLRNRLSLAIERNELYLVFQPLFATNNDKPAALEALLRWRTNDELVSPTEFIPIAEQNGKIKEIGTWVLEQGFKASKAINQLFPGTTVGINVSLLQFMDDRFITIVEQLLFSTQSQPEYINLEITESAFSLEKQLLIEKVKRLQSMGFMVSIDDFGTGYSSLASVLELSASAIKIDKSFVESLDTKGAVIIDAVIRMAERLGQRVVAEGVEHQWQADTLKKMGVHMIQGFLYAKPMPWPELISFLQQQHESD